MNEVSRAFFLKAYKVTGYVLVLTGATFCIMLLIKYFEWRASQRILMVISTGRVLGFLFMFIIVVVPYWFFSTISLLFLEREQLKSKAFKIGLVGLMIWVLVFFLIGTEVGHILFH